MGFLTSKASTAFTQLGQVFTEAPIFPHYHQESHINIKTNASGNAIGRALSQLTLDSAQWHLVAYFSRKMIPA